MEKLLRLCKRIREIPEEEMCEAMEVASGQLEFLSPLKMATTKKQRALGEYNMIVIGKLAELRAIIRRGP